MFKAEYTGMYVCNNYVRNTYVIMPTSPTCTCKINRTGSPHDVTTAADVTGG